MCVSVCAHMYVCVCACACACVCVCVCVRVYFSTHQTARGRRWQVCEKVMCVCTCVCMCMWSYMCVCVCGLTNTHTCVSVWKVCVCGVFLFSTHQTARGRQAGVWESHHVCACLYVCVCERVSMFLSETYKRDLQKRPIKETYKKTCTREISFFDPSNCSWFWEKDSVCVCLSVCLCIFVCVRERETRYVSWGWESVHTILFPLYNTTLIASPSNK